jgi:hypothetical protein
VICRLNSIAFPRLHSLTVTLIQRHDLQVQSIDGADFERFLPASTFPIEKMAADFEQHAELVLHNLEYLLCVSVHHGDTLCVEVEQRNDGTRWRGEFEAQCELRCSSSADCFAVDSSCTLSAHLNASSSALTNACWIIQLVEQAGNMTAMHQSARKDWDAPNLLQMWRRLHRRQGASSDFQYLSGCYDQLSLRKAKASLWICSRTRIWKH